MQTKTTKDGSYEFQNCEFFEMNGEGNTQGEDSKVQCYITVLEFSGKAQW